MKYNINDVYSCIQGEGSFTGQAMVMVRLQGCLVGCPWCDTKETWEAKERNLVSDVGVAFGKNDRWLSAEPSAIVAHVKRHCAGPKWILLSGGEPAEQELWGLVEGFHQRGYRVAIETSGTAQGLLRARCDWVTVSPKVNMPGKRQLLKAVTLLADEVKFPVGKPSDIDRLREMIDAGYFKSEVTICLQPLSQSATATKLCIKECLERGWRLSVQVHKYLNLP